MNDNLNDLVNLGDDDEVEQMDDMDGFVSENIDSMRNEDKFIKSEFRHDVILLTGSISDGTLPHFVNIQFHKKVFVVQISIWVDYKNDESYTPNRITVRAGTHFGDLQDLRTVELDRPCGWIDIQISGDEILRIKQQFKLNTNYEDDSDEELITFPATESFPVVR
ncbi:13106_t:CDS:2 [Entrophospora sp. SA101]|nr:13102_t:CDS:2 [Entrophospora sp. SA101]CAJ0823517.1 13106_t:CDS:2 [Entrophospora sp. SA101]